MKPLRLGLQTRFVIGLVLLLGLLLTLLFALAQRQRANQVEVSRITRDSMHGVVFERLRRDGEGRVTRLSESLVNPMYYVDLEQIGGMARSLLRQDGVEYVLVYDAQGRILHDGSGDIAAFGQPMEDPLGRRLTTELAPHTEQVGEVLDISHPITLGDQRLGGLRVGYSLAAVRGDETTAMAGLDARIDALGRRMNIAIVLLGAALLAAGLVTVAWVNRRVIVPIRALSAAAGRIEAGELDGELPHSNRDDELGELMRAFGGMRDAVARHDRDIRRVAYSDALTGLMNRRAFRESLELRLRQVDGTGHPLALLFVDIDDFKRVNDTLGHEAGDEVLLEVAARIGKVVAAHGGSDTQLARFGGDEFVVLLHAPPAGDSAALRERANAVAEGLVQALTASLQVHGRQVFLGASIGIALYPDDAAGASALLKNGDIAMYQAKVAGKNTHRFYSKAMDQAVERRMRLEHDLRGAWERGELSLAYQPIFRMRDRRLVGAEALLRWQHPEQGMVAPSVFVDVAEQSGLIEVIGPQVLLAACRDIAAMQREGADIFVSVNVSPRQLRGPDLARQALAVLAETGLPPSCLHLEITETAVLGDEAHAGALLARLRQTGVKVWLDDFGTGYSSLSHLRRVQVDGVKIDRSFVADLLRDPDDLALTGAIIAMARSLGIIAVAEGVEQEAQFELLAARGCDLAQGYWLGQPTALEGLAALVDA